jgi:hypothetical protein
MDQRNANPCEHTHTHRHTRTHTRTHPQQDAPVPQPPHTNGQSRLAPPKPSTCGRRARTSAIHDARSSPTRSAWRSRSRSAAASSRPLSEPAAEAALLAAAERLRLRHALRVGELRASWIALVRARAPTCAGLWRGEPALAVRVWWLRNRSILLWVRACVGVCVRACVSVCVCSHGFALRWSISPPPPEG